MAERGGSFTICSLNLNGIRAAERRGFSRWLTNRRPDHLCLQELRAHEDQVPDELRSPAGYCSRWNVAERKGYAGVALYTRRAPDAFRVGCGLDWGDAEGRVLRADFPELSVISLYVPSGTSSEARQELKFRFMDHLLPWMKKLAREKRPIAVCGDVNIAHTELDIHNPKANAKNSGFLPEEREWLGKLLRAGWVDVLRALHPGEPGLYSWWSSRGRAREKDLGWRIDYVLANRRLAERAEEAWIEKKAGLSDHAPVWARFRVES